MEDKLYLIHKKYGESAELLIQLYHTAYPDRDILELLSLDYICRMDALRFAKGKTAQSSASTYVYLFGAKFDFWEGTPAWHCSDIPFAFHNTELVPASFISGVSDRLEQEIAGVWTAFARTGDPNHEGLIYWPAYHEQHGATMIFDSSNRIKTGHDSELIKTLAKRLPPFKAAEKYARLAMERE